MPIIAPKGTGSADQHPAALLRKAGGHARSAGCVQRIVIEMRAREQGSMRLLGLDPERHDGASFGGINDGLEDILQM